MSALTPKDVMDDLDKNVTTGVHNLVSEATAFKWPVVVVLVSLAFGVGGAWFKLLSHDDAIKAVPTMQTDLAVMKADLHNFLQEYRQRGKE